MGSCCSFLVGNSRRKKERKDPKQKNLLDGKSVDGVVMSTTVNQLQSHYVPPAQVPYKPDTANKSNPVPAVPLNNNSGPAVSPQQRPVSTAVMNAATVQQPVTAMAPVIEEFVPEIPKSAPITMVSSVIDGDSLIAIPGSESVYLQGWVLKRGHLVRNWKKRYVVIDHKEVRYYEKKSASYPFGEGLKGQVNLIGAFLECTQEGSKDVIEVLAAEGSKDLLLGFSSSADAAVSY